MKKVILSAVIAATMSIPAFADISIKGDAHFRYASKEAIGSDDTENSTAQRVRLHFTGKKGDTTIKMGLRNDGGTRVSNGIRGTTSDGSVAEVKTGSGAGSGDNIAALNVDYLFLTTKIGPIKLKIGDWWDTTGVGLIRKGVSNVEAIEFSTSMGGVNLALETKAGQTPIRYTVSGKVSGFKIVVEYFNSNAAPTSDGGSRDELLPSYTDILVKGKIAGIGIAVEYATSDAQANSATSGGNANVFHVWKTVNGVTYHLARAAWDRGISGVYGNNGGNGGNSKFSPLGVSILGSAPGVNGKIALGNVNSNGVVSDTSVIGIRADLKIAGMGVQLAVGTLDLGNGEAASSLYGKTKTFKDIIVTRSLGKGSNIKASYGTYAGGSSVGAKISVKF